MKKIKLIFNDLGYYNINQAHIIICSNNKPIFTGETYSKEVCLCLEEEHAYTLIATSKNRILRLVFYVDKKRDTYYFYFPSRIINIITFHLTDSNYQNLPTEKGEIILWPE